jgi:ammonia channel protein AmtB
MLIPLVTMTVFFFGWWIYFAYPAGPGIYGGIEPAAADFTPWAELMGPHMQDRITGVFWAAFLPFSSTAASIVSGAVLERIRIEAFLILAVLIGSVFWIIDAAWGWHPEGLDGADHGLPRSRRTTCGCGVSGCSLSTRVSGASTSPAPFRSSTLALTVSPSSPPPTST